MLRRAWQFAMIALACNPALKRAVQGSRCGAALSRRFTAGAEPEAALARARSLARERAIRSSLAVFRESVASPAEVAKTVAEHLAIAARLAPAALDLHLSVEPAQIGLTFDPELVRRNAFALAAAVAAAPAAPERVATMTLGMEDAPSVEATIALHDALADAGLPVALTLQAYLRRSEADLERQIERGARLRLVKGAFVGGRETTFTRRAGIAANWRRLIDLALSRRARQRGVYPSIATHDETLHAYAAERAAANGWANDAWEIEMLLGLRDDLAAAHAASGRRVRLYLPFGRDWWPYSLRRIGANPANAVLLARALLAGG